MSFCVYGRIERKSINEKTIESYLNHYFNNGYRIIKQNADLPTYEIKNDHNKTIVSFINEKKYPYNIYDSDIVNTEFEYHQLLIFELDKEEITVNCYIEIIKFLRFLEEEIKSRILVTSDAHDEICLLDDKNTLWSTNNNLIKEIMSYFNP